MNELHACCVKAELSALVQMLCSINFSINGMDLRIKCEHAPTAKRIFNLIKERYQAKMQFSVMKKMKLKKNNVYILRVSSHASEILEDLEILTDAGLQAHISKESLSSDCCMRAYLAGAFLAGGSVNAPKTTNYHLEISTSEESHAEFLQALMNEYYLGAKMIKRRNQYVVYIKASDHIGDFLRLMGTSESLFKFEDRYDMVKKGTEDLDNVVVVPSGKFIISAMTFPEYFMKDYVLVNISKKISPKMTV